MFAMCLETSFLTPPVGFSLFYIKGVCPPGITTKDIYLGVLPFIALQLLALALDILGLNRWLPGCLTKCMAVPDVATIFK